MIILPADAEDPPTSMRLKEYFALQRGNHKRLTEALKTNKAYVSQLASGEKTPSLHLAREIHIATGGLVSYEDLLPPRE